MSSILLINNNTPESWSTRQDMQFSLAGALVANGHHPVMTFTREVPPDIAARLRRSGCDIERFNPEEHLVRVYRQLRRLVQAYRPQVVQTRFCSHMNPVHWLAKLLRVPTVSYIQATGGVLKCKGIGLAAVRGRARVMFLGIDHVIAISSFVKDQLILLGVEPSKISLVPNGISLQTCSPGPKDTAWLRAIGVPLTEPTIVTASYLIPIKHLHIIIEACRVLADRDVKVHLIVAGEGPLKAALQERTRQLGISQRVHFVGWLTDPVRVLRSCDLLCMASVGEAFGNIVAEAMAVGKPAVLARSGAFSELIDDGVTGFLYEPGNATELALRLECLVTNSTLRSCMGIAANARARQYALENYIVGMCQVFTQRYGVSMEVPQFVSPVVRD